MPLAASATCSHGLTAEQLTVHFQDVIHRAEQDRNGGIIGTANVEHAQPDGYTLFFGPVALLTLSPMTTKVNYDPDKDFLPVSIVASTPFVVTVNAGFPGQHACRSSLPR